MFSGDDDDQIPAVDLDDLDQDEVTTDEADDGVGAEVVEKRRRRLRMARLRRKSLAARAYQFSGSGTGVQGMVFMEIVKVTDLPPERNGMHSPTACETPEINRCSSDADII